MRTHLLLFFLFISCTVFSQTTITGNITDTNGAPLPGTNIIVTGTSDGTVTDIDGKFTLSTSKELPFKIDISNVGFKSESVQITTGGQVVNLALQEGTSLDEIVLSASRTPERIFE